VSGALFDLFCGVADILEKQTSKLRVSVVDAIEKVFESGVVLLWDEAVGDSLPEADSFNFICGLIRSFCQTFTIEKAKRTSNRMRKKAKALISVSQDLP